MALVYSSNQLPDGRIRIRGVVDGQKVVVTTDVAVDAKKLTPEDCAAILTLGDVPAHARVALEVTDVDDEEDGGEGETTQAPVETSPAQALVALSVSQLATAVAEVSDVELLGEASGLEQAAAQPRSTAIAAYAKRIAAIEAERHGKPDDEREVRLALQVETLEGLARSQGGLTVEDFAEVSDDDVRTLAGQYEVAIADPFDREVVLAQLAVGIAQMVGGG